MDNKHSDTLNQRKKAQKDFLELKKMQAGEIPPEPKYSEVAIVPKTFGEKLKNFWFHYKVPTLIALFLCVTLAIGITQCVNKPKYDAKVVLYTESYYYSGQTLALAENLEKYFTDVDQNGEVAVQILDCSHDDSDTYDMNYSNAQATKLTSILSGDASVQLFIVDDKTRKHLDTVFDSVDNFFIEILPLPKEMYKYFTLSNGDTHKPLYIGRRVVKGTLLESEKNIDIHIKSAIGAMEKIEKDIKKEAE